MAKKFLVTYLYIALHCHFENKTILTVSNFSIPLKFFFQKHTPPHTAVLNSMWEQNCFIIILNILRGSI